MPAGTRTPRPVRVPLGGYEGPGSGAPTARVLGAEHGIVKPNGTEAQRDDEIGGFGMHAKAGDAWYIQHAQQGSVALCYHLLACRSALLGVLLAAQEMTGWEQRATYAQAKVLLEEGVLWPWEDRTSALEAIRPKPARRCARCQSIFPAAHAICPACESPEYEELI
jgi:hypothetical protein